MGGVLKGFNEPFKGTKCRENINPDFIILSEVLHEVENPRELLSEISKACEKETVVHINVPNANSIHRLLAVKMDLIKNTQVLTERNRVFQQNTVFTKQSLEKLLLECGFVSIEWGGLMIKPFTHAQMQEMRQQGIINAEVIEGLYKLGVDMPEISAEMYVNAKLRIS